MVCPLATSEARPRWPRWQLSSWALDQLGTWALWYLEALEQLGHISDFVNKSKCISFQIQLFSRKLNNSRFMVEDGQVTALADPFELGFTDEVMRIDGGESDNERQGFAPGDNRVLPSEGLM
jgi:hypothetical protein